MQERIQPFPCCIGSDDYTATRVIYDDGSIGVDCNGLHDDCEYKAEALVWNERGLRGVSNDTQDGT